MHAHGLTAGQKTVENLDRAAGPSWAAGHRAAGPLGRCGPWAAGRWAAGLLLVKPLLFIQEFLAYANNGGVFTN